MAGWPWSGLVRLSQARCRRESSHQIWPASQERTDTLTRREGIIGTVAKPVAEPLPRLPLQIHHSQKEFYSAIPFCVNIHATGRLKCYENGMCG